MMRGNSIMAGPLLWVAVAAALEQGCILPQDDQVLPDLPPLRNTSPKILYERATPAKQGATVLLGNNCMDFPFEIAVEDPDKDTIRSKWFVDPDAKFSTPATDGETSGMPARVVRPVQGQFYAQNGRLALPNTLGMNTHRVTVVIADREFVPAGIGLRLNDLPGPDGGTIKEVSTVVQYDWDVTTDPTTPCQ